jgi:acetylornithine deacetylase/succinyl-diaminopimelate desuccinylase-like protein
LALASAAVFAPLREAMGPFESRTVVTEKGGVVLTFIAARRYAILTAEPDGELVLTLTDRESSEEADAEVVDGDVSALAERMRRFLAS